jgi:hypothetical protein
MPKCPNCNSNISLLQTLKHSKWTPMVCGQCKAALQFNKKKWYMITSPLLIVIISKLILTEIFNIKSVFIFGAFLILMIGALINFLIGLDSMKMKIRDE